MNVFGALTSSEFDPAKGLKFNPISRPISNNSWFEECLNTAKFIRNNTDKEIIVANSGGIDSEAICWAFLKLKIPFKVLTVVQSENTNAEDVAYSFNFCQKYNIECIRIPLDLKDFIKHKIPYYIEQGYKVTSVYKYVELFCLETINNFDACGILGGGTFQSTINTDRDDVLKVWANRNAFVNALWCKNNNVIHFPYFHATTPEIVASFFNHEIVSSLTDKPHLFKRIDGKNNKHLLKAMVYNHHIEHLDTRVKKTGYENVGPIISDIERSLKEQFPESGKLYSKPLDEVKIELGI